jgi:hypothetical protein
MDDQWAVGQPDLFGSLGCSHFGLGFSRSENVNTERYYIHRQIRAHDIG